MSVQFDHTIVPVHDKRDSAKFLADVLGRIHERGLPYWADPRRSRPCEIGVRDRGRGFSFTDPSSHFLEVLTRPDERGVAA
jgi:hypothetical protein